MTGLRGHDAGIVGHDHRNTHTRQSHRNPAAGCHPGRAGSLDRQHPDGTVAGRGVPAAVRCAACGGYTGDGTGAGGFPAPWKKPIQRAAARPLLVQHSNNGAAGLSSVALIQSIRCAHIAERTLFSQYPLHRALLPLLPAGQLASGYSHVIGCIICS